MQWALDGRLTHPLVKESRKSREGTGWEGAEENMGGSENMSQGLINKERKGEGPEGKRKERKSLLRAGGGEGEGGEARKKRERGRSRILRQTCAHTYPAAS
jgi:hypothetical protein